MQLLTNRYCKPETWAAGSDLVRRRASRIYPMQARLYGREVTFSGMYPSGFMVPCAEAEMCGVDSPLDKAWHVLLCNMRLQDDKSDLVAGRPTSWHFYSCTGRKCWPQKKAKWLNCTPKRKYRWLIKHKQEGELVVPDVAPALLVRMRLGPGLRTFCKHSAAEKHF